MNDVNKREKDPKRVRRHVIRDTDACDNKR